ncbi:hypothetical protein L2E82_12147 [Cichorium intybus]|uniref:Uncharacterized protein n=1 Tax=Cichorium intybus TaxID=13427 RepID=A0ACB9GF12_CICIN|nr:hypothetical protein L2E82_12147 [Cichorium intybus]
MVKGILRVEEVGQTNLEGEEEQSTPSWAKSDSEEPSSWARNETQQTSSSSTFELPFFVYLLASAITAIVAVGSVFEYMNQKQFR